MRPRNLYDGIRKSFLLPVEILVFVFFIWSPSLAQACATVRGPKPTSEDFIQSEQAVIIWDEAHKIEHFIRQADIRTDDPDLGFLVPTPQVPELVEVDPSIFQLAADVGRPKKIQEIVYHKPLQIFGPVLEGPAAVLALPFVSLLTGMSERDDSNELKIVSEQDVAGYHAVVLAADNAAALALWLKENGYESTPELEAWLKPYVAAKWTITAFKLIKPKPSDGTFLDASKPIVTHAIRMSFATDRPFFPYSEPGDKQRAHAASPYGRTLRVAVLSSGRMQGVLADGSPWPGNLLFAGSPKPDTGTVWTADKWMTFAKLDGQLTLPAMLTYWRDDSNPRPGTTDLYFSPAPEQSSFRKTEIDYSIPALHLFDLTDLFSDIAGLIIVVLLPGAPLYCGWRLIRLNHPRRISPTAALSKSQALFEIRRIFGFFAVMMGSLYCVSCLIAAYMLRNIADSLPGKPLPSLCNPVVLIAVGGLFLTLVHCGVRAFRRAPTADKPYQHRTMFGRYWDYLMAGGSILIGAAFSFAIVTVFIIRFTE